MDGRWQQGASYEYGAIFWKNLNQVFIRELDKDYALFRSFLIEICQFVSFNIDISM